MPILRLNTEYTPIHVRPWQDWFSGKTSFHVDWEMAPEEFQDKFVEIEKHLLDEGQKGGFQASWVVGDRGSGKSQVLVDLTDRLIKKLVREGADIPLPVYVQLDYRRMRVLEEVAIVFDSLMRRLRKGFANILRILEENKNQLQKRSTLSRLALSDEILDLAKHLEDDIEMSDSESFASLMNKLSKEYNVNVIFMVDDLDKAEAEQVHEFLSFRQGAFQSFNAQFVFTAQPDKIAYLKGLSGMNYCLTTHPGITGKNELLLPSLLAGIEYPKFAISQKLKWVRYSDNDDSWNMLNSEPPLEGYWGASEVTGWPFGNPEKLFGRGGGIDYIMAIQSESPEETDSMRTLLRLIEFVLAGTTPESDMDSYDVNKSLEDWISEEDELYESKAKEIFSDRDHPSYHEMRNDLKKYDDSDDEQQLVSTLTSALMNHRVGFATTAQAEVTIEFNEQGEPTGILGMVDRLLNSGLILNDHPRRVVRKSLMALRKEEMKQGHKDEVESVGIFAKERDEATSEGSESWTRIYGILGRIARNIVAPMEEELLEMNDSEQAMHLRQNMTPKLLTENLDTSINEEFRVRIGLEFETLLRNEAKSQLPWPEAEKSSAYRSFRKRLEKQASRITALSKYWDTWCAERGVSPSTRRYLKGFFQGDKGEEFGVSNMRLHIDELVNAVSRPQLPERFWKIQYLHGLPWGGFFANEPPEESEEPELSGPGVEGTLRFVGSTGEKLILAFEVMDPSKVTLNKGSFFCSAGVADEFAAKRVEVILVVTDKETVAELVKRSYRFTNTKDIWVHNVESVHSAIKINNTFVKYIIVEGKFPDFVNDRLNT